MFISSHDAKEMDSKVSSGRASPTRVRMINKRLRKQFATRSRASRSQWARNRPQRSSLLFIEIQGTQAIANLRSNLNDLHSWLDHQLAGERLTPSIAFRRFERNAAVLALFVPAETPHGDVVW